MSTGQVSLEYINEFRREIGQIRSSLGLFGLLILGWEMGIRVTGTPPVILPAPSRIALAIVGNWRLLLEASSITAGTALMGLLGGIAIGFPLAFVISRSNSLAAVVLPYILILRIAPLIAIAPLLFLWTGSGLISRALLIITMTIFPIVIASYDGLQAVPREYVDLATSVGISEWTRFLRIEIPAAAPSVFAGIKLAAALSLVGAVVAEFVTLDSGIGYQIFHASRYLQTPLMFASLTALAVLGLLFYGLPALAQNRSPSG